MVWVLLRDENLRLLRPYQTMREKTYFQVLNALSRSFLEKLCGSISDCVFTVVLPFADLGERGLCVFSSDPADLLCAINQISEPSSPHNQSFQELVSWTLTEITKYWGPSEPVYMLVFTDGHASVLDCACDTSDCCPFTLKDQWPNSTILFFTLMGNKLSRDLHRVYEHFLPHAAIFSVDNQLKSYGPSFDVAINNGSSQAVRDCLQWLGLDGQPDVCLKCGHISEPVQLNPVLSAVKCESRRNQPSLCLEIFGFLNASDLSNPPVASRHCLKRTVVDKTSPLLPLLLASMQETKTVAMCSIFTLDTTRKSVGLTKSLWRHGFVHSFDSKLPYLMLSVFPTDCFGLPWIGQFKHLAPVEDFTGVHLYDDREGTSPFPVLAPDRLSYGTLSDSGSSTRRANPVTFRYVSWTSSSSLLSDVNKVLRLGRRLPDKSALFFKELTRVRSATLVYGCPDLLDHVATLTEAAHATELSTNNSASAAVHAHLQTMRSLIQDVVCDLAP